MAPSWINEGRMDMLEKLNEIRLTGFQEIDVTPSSVATSLPTPHEESVPLDGQIQVLAPEQMQTDATNDFVGNYDGRLTPPAAPLMKDYDSFTEGTAKGSFDSIPADDTDGVVEPNFPLNSLSLSLLPNKSLSIETWRANVQSSQEADLDTPCTTSAQKSKRPRSICDEDDQRRTQRPRRRCLSVSSSSPSLRQPMNALALELSPSSAPRRRRSLSLPPRRAIPPD